MWWNAEVGVTGRSQREVQAQSPDVQHDRDATDQAIVIRSAGGSHGRAHIGDGGEATVHCGGETRECDLRGRHRGRGIERSRMARRRRSAAS
jgi:hypothetical protein